jgi:hypothetical protein
VPAVTPRGPEPPDTQAVTALQMLSGNAQLLKIHEQRDDLAAKLAAWKKSGDAITKRWPGWERLQDFQRFRHRPARGRGHGRVHRRHHRRPRLAGRA